MTHQVYIFLAFFNSLGFVEIKAIEEGWIILSPFFDCFGDLSFMFANNLLVTSYVKSHQKLRYVMPYVKYNKFIWKGPNY